MATEIIKANPKKTRKPADLHLPILEIAEFYCDTIQGEGVNTGAPAAFLRLQHCTLNCVWCDTRSVWRYGNPYTIHELFHLMDQVALPEKLYNGQHLVLTGGSPLKQQHNLVLFLQKFEKIYGFHPYTEIENEGVLPVQKAMQEKINCWNNSPKLSNSGNPAQRQYKPKCLQQLSSFDNSWFKFVVESEEDWNEIESSFLKTKHIRKDQVILMPLGDNIDELERNRTLAAELAIKHNVRYCTREHIVLWDTATGV